MTRFTYRPRISRHLGKALLLAAITAVALVTGPISVGRAASLPLHSPGIVECFPNASTIRAWAPTRITSWYAFPGEAIHWSSVLEVWTGTAWKVYGTPDAPNAGRSAPWYHGVATTDGLQSKWSGYGNVGTYAWTNDRGEAIFNPFQDYPVRYRGYYRVWSYISWTIPQSDAMLATTYNGASASYCFIP
jgi:hypothetical protein